MNNEILSEGKIIQRLFTSLPPLFRHLLFLVPCPISPGVISVTKPTKNNETKQKKQRKTFTPSTFLLHKHQCRRIYDKVKSIPNLQIQLMGIAITTTLCT